MVCGTGSDAGKSTVVTGLCRWLARRGVRVAPFKAQNMANNSWVTAGGGEIGRSTAAQALAAGAEPEVAMNPILLKPTGERSSQVILGGRPWATTDAAGYRDATPALRLTVTEALDDLRARYDVVVCEGAGSPAEINLLGTDIVNLSVAVDAHLPAVVVGDIERGGVFAALFGTVSLLPPEQRRAVRGFVINRFRGDPALLGDGPAQLERRCGVRTLGVLPWVGDVDLDAEDSLVLDREPAGGDGAATLDVAVVRLPRIANATDVDPLVAEPGVAVRFVRSLAALGQPDLLVLPGTKTTVDDLEWLRRTGLAEAVVALASDPTTTVLGICGGYQMLGRRIDDRVEAAASALVNGLGLLDAETTFVAEKTTAQRRGSALACPSGRERGGCPVAGYEIHHGRTTASHPWLRLDGVEEGCAAGGRLFGTSLHGLLESDTFRDHFLQLIADRAGKSWTPSGLRFADRRAQRADRLADLLAAHLDMAALDALISESRT